MLLNHACDLTPNIQALLNTIDGTRTAFSHISVKPELKHNYRRNSLLQSALYSARIEGIDDSTDLNKLAIQNLESAYAWLYTQDPLLPIDTPLIKSFHTKALHNLRADAGHFRTEQSAIFNSAGIAIYLTPPPQEISNLLKLWQKQSYEPCFPHPLIQALVMHYQFEKIHPFLDGNGRVGRLILTQQLRAINYDFEGMLAIEEWINNSRAHYYANLSNEGKDLTQFVEYFLDLIMQASHKMLLQITQAPLPNPASSLLPRRAELVNIIHDHSPCSLDFLSRRFFGVPLSTLRNDLLQLQKLKLIQKLGNTRGALYSCPE